MIELLAIVTVLSIILLVSFPTLINMTRSDRERQYNDMVKTLCKAGETYIYNNKDLFPELGVAENILYVETNTLMDYNLVNKNEINPKTKKNLFGRLEYTVQSDKSLKCNFNPSLCTLEKDDLNDGLSIGDEYKCRVNNNDIYTFYVLSLEDDKVNLIMDRNICNDGTISYTSGNNYCRYKWYSASDNNTYGPTTVMAELYAGTKDWDNVEDMVMNYTDENNGSAEDKGYTSIITTNGVTTITGKPTTNTTTVGTSAKPLKARIPKESEVTGAGCSTTSSGSCPTWLMENMTYYNVSNDKYSMNNNSEAYQNQIYGYWLLSSSPGGSYVARDVLSDGFVGNHHYTTYGACGARPVITVQISDFSN